MTVALLPLIRAKFFTPGTNTPLAGGKVYTYAAGTSTPLATYTDSSGGTPNANPVVLDANGEAPIYLTASLLYKINVLDASNVQVAGYPVDNIGGESTTVDLNNALANIANNTDVTKGTSLVGSYNYQIPAYLKVQSDINFGQEISIDSFLNISIAKRIQLRASTLTDDLTTYFENACTSGAKGIYFPYGTYVKKGNTAPNNQKWRGDGIDITTIQEPQSNQTLNYNFLEGGTSDLTNFMTMDMTLKGSLDFQTSGASSQKGFAIYCRGAINNVHFIRTKFIKFGDQLNFSGGGNGGAIVIGTPSTSPVSGKASGNISAQFCIFDTNNNVPGIYFSQGGDGGAENIMLLYNYFNGGDSHGSAQNCAFILGGDFTHKITGVTALGNRFNIKNSIDQCLELNWVEDFAIHANPMRVRAGVTTCTGHILARDGCINGAITGNTALDNSGNSTAGITLTRFASPGSGTQENIAITGNTVYGFDRGIDIDSGSINVLATGNTIRGCAEGIRLAGCSDIDVSDNKQYYCGYAASFAGGIATMRRVKYKRNNSYNGTLGVFASGGGLAEDIQYLEVEDNVDQGSAGTYMFDMTMAAATGNRFINNRSSLTPLNPIDLTSFAVIQLADVPTTAIASGATTPSVRTGINYTCGATAGTIIGALQGTGYVGQEVYIKLAVNWTVDFTGTTLKGNGGVDLVGTATNAIKAKFDGTNWLCEVIGA